MNQSWSIENPVPAEVIKKETFSWKLRRILYQIALPMGAVFAWLPVRYIETHDIRQHLFVGISFSVFCFCLVLFFCSKVGNSVGPHPASELSDEDRQALDRRMAKFPEVRAYVETVQQSGRPIVNFDFAHLYRWIPAKSGK